MVESVIGFALISVGLMAAVALLNTSFLFGAHSQHHALAEQILQQMSEFYSQDYVRGYGDTTYTLDPVVGPDQLLYRRQFKLSTYSTDLATPIRRLELLVSYDWKGKITEKRRVRLLCRPGR